MIHYQAINGVSLNNSTGLPSVTRTPEGLAMGSIPYWDMLIDPAYVSSDNSRVRDRAKPNSFGVSFGSGENPAIQTGLFDNGQIAFERDGSGSPGIGFAGPMTINPDAWTFFFVARVTEENHVIGGIRMAANDSDLSGEGELGLYVALSTPVSGPVGGRVSLFEQWEGSTGATPRIQADIGLTADNHPSVIMITFSTQRGLSIYKNGLEVANNAEDSRPLTIGLDGGDVTLLANAAGRYGMLGLLNLDLSALENTGHRRAIEKFLMAKYGIPEGPQ